MIHFVPNEPLAEALAQARRDAEAWQVLRIAGADREMQWRNWAGDEIEEMMRSPDRTIRHLGSSDTDLRLAALALIVDYWPPTESFAAPCLRLAFEDAESVVRGAALRCLLRLQFFISDRTGWLKKLLESLFGRASGQFRARARRLLREADAVQERFKREGMKKLAGTHLDTMLQSRAAAESFLNSPDPKMRYAALFVLAQHWGMTKDFADQCEAIVYNDPDTKVRSGALANVGNFYNQSDDGRVGQMLAEIVYGAGEPTELRTHAYRLLFHVRGMPLALKEKAWSPEFRFPEDVDWAFVDSFLP